MTVNPVMYDDAATGELPEGAYAYAAYVDGYANFADVVRAHPGAHHLSVTIAGNRAQAADYERGAMGLDAAPGWHRRMTAAGYYRPVHYTMASQLDALESELGSAGIPRGSYRLWSAHVDAGEHFCGPGSCGYGRTGADATQWTFTALGRELDQSTLRPDFFAGRPAGQWIKPHYWRWTADGGNSLAGIAARRSTTAAVIAAHTMAKDSPLDDVNRKAFKEYEQGPKGTGRLMPAGLVYYTWHK
jgi:hypothetical protein